MTIITRTLIAAAGIGVFSVAANAQQIETTVSGGVESEYVFRGLNLASDIVWGGVDVSIGNGYVGVWGAEPFDNEEFSNQNEIDLYAGYKYLLNETLTLDFGGTLYHYPRADDQEETFEFYAGIIANTVAAPSLYFYYDVDLETFTTEASVSHSFDLNEKMAIEVGLASGYVREDNGGDYFYYGANADYVYKFTDRLKASAGIRAGGNDSRLGFMGKDDNAWAGFSISSSF